MTHLKELEAESIFIFREVVAEFQNPVMLFSSGKDSCLMLRLAQKAFYPGRIPFPLLHIDTTWDFKEVYEFRDRTARENNLQIIVHTNQEAIRNGINPFDSGSVKYTHNMNLQGLLQALKKYQFDAAFGGARREEEKSRAKERIFSFRDKFYQWDPKNQRPEMWNLYNARINKGESIRVFPLSNWTEIDIWQYLHIEKVPLVPLYFAQPRPVVKRDGLWIYVNDHRYPLQSGETPETKTVRFRTLGCYPLTGAIESTADTLPKIIEEMLLFKNSERAGRAIDHDEQGSMEQKKREGYF
ncbi:MAG: sulfate adenylyltransferase subunit CysD [Phycisphaerae bacterium]|nr:sulfate adenylyltransferase subunit CysD [Phycisphaerae bacterium]